MLGLIADVDKYEGARDDPQARRQHVGAKGDIRQAEGIVDQVVGHRRDQPQQDQQQKPLGPSGIGKTTQAERWAQFRGSSIINGDVGFVQRTGQGYTAWGSPWHGSSPYCLNASVPVKALVVLKQAPENKLRELTGFEKVTEVSGSVFYPTWLEDGMELCTDTLNHLLTDLPVYRLDNRADRESVEILAKELDRIT